MNVGRVLRHCLLWAFQISFEETQRQPSALLALLFRRSASKRGSPEKSLTLSAYNIEAAISRLLVKTGKEVSSISA